MNISSNEPGLGGALTNMTVLAQSKGRIHRAYPVTIAGMLFVDAESAYQNMKVGDPERDDATMAYIICEKFLQHKHILTLTTYKGGVPFLEKCTHFTNARTARYQAWEGVGRSSRFIRNLINGYTKAEESTWVRKF